MAQLNEPMRLRAKCRCFTNILSNSCHLSIRVIRDLEAQYVNYLVKVQNIDSLLQNHAACGNENKKASRS